MQESLSTIGYLGKRTGCDGQCKIMGSGIAPPSPTHSMPGDNISARFKLSTKKLPDTQSGQSTSAIRLPSLSPPTSIEPFEFFSRLDQMGQQLTTIMATVIKLQFDFQKFKDKLP